jgi:hypothetical protein
MLVDPSATPAQLPDTEGFTVVERKRKKTRVLSALPSASVSVSPRVTRQSRLAPSDSVLDLEATPILPMTLPNQQDILMQRVSDSAPTVLSVPGEDTSINTPNLDGH